MKNIAIGMGGGGSHNTIAIYCSLTLVETCLVFLIMVENYRYVLLDQNFSSKDNNQPNNNNVRF